MGKNFISKKLYFKWFHKWKLNTCYNCIDRHVKNGNGLKYAIFYDSPVANIKKKKNFLSKLLDNVSSLAAQFVPRWC